MLQRIWEVSIDDAEGNTRWFYTVPSCTYRDAVLQGLSRECEFMGKLASVMAMPVDWTPLRRDYNDPS